MKPGRWKVSLSKTKQSSSSDRDHWKQNKCNEEGTHKFNQKIIRKDILTTGKINWTISTLPVRKIGWRFNRRLRIKRINWKIISRNKLSSLRKSIGFTKNRLTLKRNIWQLWLWVARKLNKLFKKMSSSNLKARQPVLRTGRGRKKRKSRRSGNRKCRNLGEVDQNSALKTIPTKTKISGPNHQSYQ